MTRSLSVEAVLYLVIGLLAAWLRLAHLDQPPLSDAEATAALSAVESAFAPEQLDQRSAAYRTATAAVFALGGVGEAAARLVPAMAGVLLVFVPLLLRRELGSGVAFTSAFLLAISPTFWSAARSAGGVSLGVLGVAAGLAFAIRSRHQLHPNLELAAVAGGLALVSGAAGLTGATSLLAAWLVFALLRRRRSPQQIRFPLLPSDFERGSLERALLAGGAVGLALGAGFGLAPEGLELVFGGMGEWAAGWFRRAGYPAGTLLLQLPAYEPLVLIFGGIGLVDGLRRGRDLQAALASWAVGAVALSLIHVGREPSEILWVVLPLTLLAAPAVALAIERAIAGRPVWVMLGAGGGITALLGFAYLQLRGYVGSVNAAQQLLGVPALLGLAVMGFLLAATALSLVAAGWSIDLARRVAGGVGLVTLLSLTISAGAALNSAQPAPTELWHRQTSTAGLMTLQESLRTLSEAEIGQPSALPIQAVDSPSPSLAWVLREYPRYQGLGPSASPPAILVREGGQLPGEYLGQSLSIGELRVWPTAYPPQLLSWWLTRSGPTSEQRWVLLVRPDVAGIEQLDESEQGDS